MEKRPQYKREKRPATNATILEYGKIPPQATDIEEVILGALMIERETVKQVVEKIQPEMFYKESHQQIFTAIKTLFEKSAPVDILTVTNELKELEKLDVAGGPYYIAQLTKNVASTANIEFHVKISFQKYLAREIIRITSESNSHAFEDFNDPFEVLDNLQNELSILSDFNNLDISKIADEANIDDKTKLKPYKVILGEKAYNEAGEREIIEIMSSGNLSMMNGKSKSRKSFAIMAFCSLILNTNNHLLGYTSNFEGGIVVFDTEQFKHHTKRFYDRLKRIVDVSNFKIFNLRAYNKETRLKFIKNYIEREKPALAFIDNIRDVIKDFNDIAQSDDIITALSNIMERTGTHICCTLHVNKSDNNARGHIGSELTQKAETVFMIENFAESGITEIRGEYCRNKPFKTIQFKLENSVPVFLDGQQIIEVKTNAPF